MVNLKTILFESIFLCRPGASSGTLLGAVTLPAVILSRLIQLSRVLLENNATSDGRASHLYHGKLKSEFPCNYSMGFPGFNIVIFP